MCTQLLIICSLWALVEFIRLASRWDHSFDLSSGSSVDYGHKTENYFSSYAQQEILHNSMESPNLATTPASSAPLDSRALALQHPEKVAFLFTSIAALSKAIRALARPPDEVYTATIEDPVARRADYVIIYAYKSSILLMCYSTDPTLGTGLADMISRYSRSLAFTQTELNLPALAATLVVAAPLHDVRPNKPTIIKCNRTKCSRTKYNRTKRNNAKCNLNKPRTITKWKNSVSLFLASMYTAISTLTFSDNKQKAHILVRYFMDGLNPQSVPANLKLMMQTYLVDNPTSTVTDLYQHAEHILDTIHGAAPCVHTSAVVALPALPAVTIGIRPEKPTIVSARQ
jgi:hypothetical protein